MTDPAPSSTPLGEVEVGWKDGSVVTLREQFIFEALEPGANMSAVCRKYGISRKTGYKWLRRFREGGRRGLEDRSRKPHDSPLRIDGEIVLQIVEIRQDHPRWGPKKIRAILCRRHPSAELPCVRTIGRVLRRAGLVQTPRRRPKVSAPSHAPAPTVDRPNDLWTVDLKGSWLTLGGTRVEPLTVRDAYSRFVLAAALLDRNTADNVQKRFVDLFSRFGMPRAILVDNGAPFISTKARAGLTRLSAWWVSLGIELHRSRPGHPQDNGGHERMHLDLRYEVEDLRGADRADCMQKLELWRHEFNEVRPHEALNQRVPAVVYEKSPRPYVGPLTPVCPEDFEPRRLSRKGFLRFQGQATYISESLASKTVFVRSLDAEYVQVRYHDVELGIVELRA